MRIGELARRSGVAPTALRYYETESCGNSSRIWRSSRGGVPASTRQSATPTGVCKIIPSNGVLGRV